MYGRAGADLLAALNRKVFLTQQGADAATAGFEDPQQVTDLILYDPETDEAYQSKVRALQEATAAAEAAAAQCAAAEAAVAAALGASGGEEGGACEGPGIVSPALAAGEGHAEGAAAVHGAHPQGESEGRTDPAAAASIEQLQAAAAQARAQATAAQAAAAAAARAAGPARGKVHADPFLVEKLRPHQREGVRFVFSCLCGTRQDGVSGAVLADGMGLGKTFQTVGCKCMECCMWGMCI